MPPKFKTGFHFGTSAEVVFMSSDAHLIYSGAFLASPGANIISNSRAWVVAVVSVVHLCVPQRGVNEYCSQNLCTCLSGGRLFKRKLIP